MEFVFILVEPAVPENIGAAARAIKTMGFSQLRLVNTQSHLADEARWLAHGSTEILDNAPVFLNLEEAIADLDFTLGTTAKNRSVKFDYYNPQESMSFILNKKDIIQKVGIVFGREESGLTNQELQCCDIATTIPIKTSYPSLNLAQSVMIMAYALAQSDAFSSDNSNKPANYVLLKNKASDVLQTIGIKKGDNLYGRIIERLATVNATDANLFLSFFNKLNSKLF